jgi:hypothetical protein
LPANGTYGNAGLDSLRGPGFVQVDASIFRDIPITERATFQFRVEAFNLFNHPNLANPNGTFGFGGFNVITATSSSGTNRVGQLAAKLLF